MFRFLLSVAVVAMVTGCATTDHTLDMYIDSPPLPPTQRALKGGEDTKSCSSTQTRFYPVEDGAVATFAAASSASPSNAPLQQLFEDAGVSFPAGTSVKYNKRTKCLIVSNSRENLEKFEAALARFESPGRQIEAAVQILEVSNQRAASLLKRRPIFLPQLSTLVGHGIQILDSSQILATSAIQTEIKSCTGSEAGRVERCSYRLNFTPVIKSDEYTVSLTLTWHGALPGVGRLSTGERNGDTLEVVELATSFELWDGQTCGFELPTRSRSGQRSYWLIFSVRIVDFSGTPIHELKK